ncbi:MAG: hypothetical protein KDC98_00865, partial [Planctomycetes bacterium]|nr:hypothetical protein [Planctomycetota bacterium]
MNVPNLITTSRLIITAGVFVTLELSARGAGESAASPDRPDLTLVWVAFTLFLVAAFTDFI